MSNNLEIKINKNSTPYLIVLSLLLGIGVGAIATSVFDSPFSTQRNSTQEVVQSNTDLNIDEDYFRDVTNLVQDSYIGDLPEQKDLTYGAIKGYLESLGNQYNSFLTPDEAKLYLESRNPDIEGIGVTLRFDGENTVIETVLSGYPADKAGLRNGDVITSVDGEAVTGQMPSIVASKVRGKAGTDVTVEIFRSESTQGQLEFTVKREKIEIENIAYKNLGNGIYKISISQFMDSSADEFNRKWNSTVDAINNDGNVKGIIMDLRSNPGGYVYGVRHVLEEFLSSGKILMSEELKNKPQVDFRDSRAGSFEDIPLVVLVNEGSASASEIFASAIQDNNRGKVVGMKTVGKGVEQQVMTMQDSSILILVFQKWLTPSGRNVTPEDPVTPDFVVDYTEDDVKSGLDPQLEKAKLVMFQ